jgi:hypothetical protein
MSTMFLTSAGPSPGAGATAIAAAPTRTGFSYSPLDSQAAGIDPAAGLATLLRTLHPDLVRLPVYWSHVAPRPGSFDFSEVDSLLAVIAQHNGTKPRHTTRVVLSVGVRNFSYPEAYIPDWVSAIGPTSVADAQALPQYLDYLTTSVSRYATNELIDSWQIENEPLDKVSDVPAGDPSLTATAVAGEVAVARALDGAHPIVVTTYDSATLDLDQKALSDPTALDAGDGPRPAGHPAAALDLADVLGLDAYVVTAPGQADSAPAATRIGWKAAELAFWKDRALGSGQKLWITEMEGEPFSGTAGFGPADLVDSALRYNAVHPSVVLLWGAGTWLSSPSWLEAARKATRTFRGRSA